MAKTNSYFDGKVQSVGFERFGRKQTVGVIEPGEYHFGTDGAERMSIISGEVSVKVDGDTTTVVYPAGSSFEVGAKSGFTISARNPAAYWCEFI